MGEEDGSGRGFIPLHSFGVSRSWSTTAAADHTVTGFSISLSRSAAEPLSEPEKAEMETRLKALEERVRRAIEPGTDAVGFDPFKADDGGES
jgi:hypothetical protein